MSDCQSCGCPLQTVNVEFSDGSLTTHERFQVCTNAQCEEFSPDVEATMDLRERAECYSDSEYRLAAGFALNGQAA